MRSGMHLSVVLCLLAASSAFGGEDAPYFVDVAKEAGLASVPAIRAAFVDLNGDGFLDCVLKHKSTYVFLNIGRGKGGGFMPFTEPSRIAWPGEETAERRAGVLIFADVDNDGDMDAFSGMFCDFENPSFKGDRTARSAILLNDGEGVFSLLDRSGVDEHPATTCAATFFDYDRDGWIDLFVGNWYREYGESLACYQDRLYRGVGGGRFKDATREAGLETDAEPGGRWSAKPVYGAGHCDYNNDGLQDLLVCVYGRQWNFLWENKGDGRFEDAAERTGFDGDGIRHGRYPEWLYERLRELERPPREDEEPFRSNGNTFSVACADYDCDGDVDLFLGEITHGWAGDSSDLSSLLTNLGEEKGFVFRRDPEVAAREHEDERRWNQGDIHVAWCDFDNDGWQDLLISSGDYPDAQYLRMFRQREDHTFEDVTDACGFDWESSAGISLGDFDRDGDVDILAGKSWMRMPRERRRGVRPAPALFRNDVGNRNNWLTVILQGKGEGGANRFGVGARITVEAGGRTRIREIRGGCGHSGQFDPPEAHFGLGKADRIDKLTVRWPNKGLTTQVFEGVEPNRIVRIIEGKGMEEY